MDGILGHQINTPTEDLAQVVLKGEDPEPNPSIRLEHVQQVHITRVRLVPRATEPNTLERATPNVPHTCASSAKSVRSRIVLIGISLSRRTRPTASITKDRRDQATASEAGQTRVE